MHSYVVISVESRKKRSWIHDDISTNHEVGRGGVLGL
jgi:hypothetical protein